MASLLLLAMLLMPTAYRLLVRITATSDVLIGGYSVAIKRFVADLIFLAVACFWGMRVAKGNGLRNGAVTVGLLFLLLLICRISIGTSPYSSSRSYYEFIKLLSATLLCCYFYELGYSIHGDRCLRIFSTILCIVAFGESVIGVVQYFTGADLSLQWAGERHLSIDMPDAAVLSLGMTGKWLFERSPTTTLVTSITALRAHGTFDHPNLFGGFLVLALLVSCGLLRDIPNRIARVMLLASIVIQMVALLLTFSRSAWLGAAIAISLFLWSTPPRERWAPMRALVIGSGVCMLLFYEPFLIRAGVVGAIAHPCVGSASFAMDAGRQQYQDGALLMVALHPWIGVGFSQFTAAFADLCKTIASVHPLPVHNIYLLIAAETGIVGLILLLLFLASVLMRLHRVSWHRQGGVFFAAIIAFCCIGCWDNYFFVMQAGRVMFFGAIGAFLATSRRWEMQAIALRVAGHRADR